MVQAGPPTPPAVIVPDSLTALGVVRSLAVHGVPCTVCAATPLGPAQYSRHARAVACPPPNAGRAFVEALLAIGRSFSVPPVLFVTDESSLVMVAHHREELAAVFRLTVPAAVPLATLISKAHLYAVGTAAGVPVPETWVVDGDAVPRGLSYPLVLKPSQRVILIADALRSFRDEFGSKAILVNDAEQMRRLVVRAHRLGFQTLVQRLVPGRVANLLTAGIFAGRDGTRALFTARKLAQVPSAFGDGSVVEGMPIPELAPLVWRLVDEIGFVGIADVEFKRDPRDGQLKLLDMNPRPWLWIELATRCGVNLPYLLYGEATQRRSESPPVQGSVHATWCTLPSLARTLGGRHHDVSERVVAVMRVLRTSRATPWPPDHVLWRMLSTPQFWIAAVGAARRRLATSVGPDGSD